MAQINFDATTVAPQESFSIIPAGVYNAQVVDSDIAPLKSGNGTGLKLTFQVLDGPCANRKVFANLNVSHNNPEAEKIGQSQLSALCHAVGVLKVKDSTDLHGKPLRIRIAIRKDDTGKYGDQNEVKAFEKIGGAVASAPSMFPSAPAPAAPAAAKAPWQRTAA